MGEKDFFPLIVQGGSFTALCYVIYWATQKMVPVLERIRETVEIMQKAFFEKLDDRERQHHQDLVDLQRLYRANCDVCRQMIKQLLEQSK